MMTKTKTVNERYREAFEGTELWEAKDHKREVDRQALAEWDERKRAEQKRRQPRARKNFKPLDEEWLEKLRRELFEKYNLNELEAKIDQLRSDQHETLTELAPQVVFEPDETAMHVVKSASAGSYRSQTQPEFYAESSLKPLAAALHNQGIDTHIQRVGSYRIGKIPVSGNYKLWAACPEWMAHAAEQTVTWEIISAAIGRTANPKVLYPMLPYEFLEQHFGA